MYEDDFFGKYNQGEPYDSGSSPGGLPVPSFIEKENDCPFKSITTDNLTEFNKIFKVQPSPITPKKKTSTQSRLLYTQSDIQNLLIEQTEKQHYFECLQKNINVNLYALTSAIGEKLSNFETYFWKHNVKGNKQREKEWSVEVDKALLQYDYYCNTCCMIHNIVTRKSKNTDCGECAFHIRMITQSKLYK